MYANQPTGQPAGEPIGAIFDVIQNTFSALEQGRQYSKGTVAFEFAQVGNDQSATKFLSGKVFPQIYAVRAWLIASRT
jgi:hypothetical protein